MFVTSDFGDLNINLTTIFEIGGDKEIIAIDEQANDELELRARSGHPVASRVDVPPP